MGGGNDKLEGRVGELEVRMDQLVSMGILEATLTFENFRILKHLLTHVIKIDGNGSLVIQMGDAQITAKRDGTIVIDGKDITIRSTNVVAVKGSKVKIDGEVGNSSHLTQVQNDVKKLTGNQNYPMGQHG